MDIKDPSKMIKEWVELYSDKMYTWAFYKTNSKEISEDIIQDTFLIAFQTIQKFEGKSDPKTWLFSILKNKIAEHYRKIYRSPIVSECDQLANNADWFSTFFDEGGSWVKTQRPDDWGDEQGNLLDDFQFIKILQACMGKLPAKWNAAICLKFIEDKKGEDICQELAITTTNYWQMLHRAKLQLRKCLEINWFKK